MPTIEIQHLSKQYGDVTAVDDLSFVARQGSVTGFLGPNGAGKTTTLRMLLGLAGALLGRPRVAAITIALVGTQVVAAVLVGFLPEVGKWLPGGAASALAGVSTPNGGLLPMGAAAVLLAVYGVAFAAAGASTLVRRDIA